MIWLRCCFSGIMAKFVSKLSYVFSLLSFRKFYFLQKKEGNNLPIGDFTFSLQKLSSEEVFFPHLFVEIFLSGNFIFISLNKSRCSKHLCMRSQVMGEERNKKQMCASAFFTRIPFFLFMQQATLEVRLET